MEYGNALKELSEAIDALAGEFDKPLDDSNIPKWERLNKAQNTAKELLSR